MPTNEVTRRDGGGGGSAHLAAVRWLAHAWDAGDTAMLRVVIDPRATVVVDSGRAGASPSSDGVDAVVDLLMRLRSAHGDLSLQEQSVNGRAGLVCRDGPTVVAVVSVQVQAARVRRLWIVSNPDKLRPWNPGS